MKTLRQLFLILVFMSLVGCTNLVIKSDETKDEQVDSVDKYPFKRTF